MLSDPPSFHATIGGVLRGPLFFTVFLGEPLINFNKKKKNSATYKVIDCCPTPHNAHAREIHLPCRLITRDHVHSLRPIKLLYQPTDFFFF